VAHYAVIHFSPHFKHFRTARTTVENHFVIRSVLYFQVNFHSVVAGHFAPASAFLDFAAIGAADMSDYFQAVNVFFGHHHLLSAIYSPF
jgi:hypothetical protein